MSKGVIISNSETAAMLEKLARMQAFHEFEKQILFSCTVWITDTSIHEYLQTPTEYIRDCIQKLESINKVKD